MAKQARGSIQAKRMSEAVNDQQEPGHGSGSVFKGPGRANEPDNLPRVGKKSYKEETKKEEPIEIKVPAMAVVNQRIFCIPVSNTMRQNEAGIWEPIPTTMQDKAGNMREMPRYFVAKCSPDIFMSNGKEEININLPVGTEIFPFFPEAEEWSFPQVYDPTSGVRYTVFHWTELSGYLIPDKDLEVKK